MSEAAEKESSLEDDFKNISTLKTEWDGRQVDWLIQWLCGFVNDAKLSIGITLTVGGSTYTGTLISHEKYFQRIAEDLSKPFAANPESEKALRERILGFHAEGTSAEPQLPVQYIHMDNTRVITAGQQIFANTGTLWRGKISAVDGFVLGEIRRS